jgi:hypothetical protein
MIVRRYGNGPGGRLGLLALVTVLGLVASGARAQDQREAHEPGAGDHEAHEAAGEHDDSAETLAGHPVHAEYRNGLALFLGGTLETAEDETFGTIGLEYERLLADRWAFQLVLEHVRDFDAWVITAPVAFRLGGTLWAVAGPGLETDTRRTGLGEEPHRDMHATDGDEHSDPHGEGEGPFFLWRFGLVYGIHLGESGRFALVPSLSLDLVREHGEWVEAWVFGVGLTVHF